MPRIARTLSTVIALGLACGLATVAPSQDLPPGHPTVETAEALPADVATIPAIVDAYYSIISGPAGQARDWPRFRSLFAPDMRFITTRQVGEALVPAMLTLEQFIQGNRNYFERGGYFEAEVNREVQTFGKIAHVFSTYESRRTQEDASPYSRGINSLQLLHANDRWWIVTVMWESERSDGPSIPDEYLGTATPAEGG